MASDQSEAFLRQGIDAEITMMLDEERDGPEPVVPTRALYERLAGELHRELERDGGANFDPPDPQFWRAVAAELRRRAATGE